MIRLTPELFLISAFDGDTAENETRELDFNLARRSGVVINRIVGYMEVTPDTTTGFDITRRVIQEVDLDPDNILVGLGGTSSPDSVEVDSSRIFRQLFGGAWDTAAGATSSPDSILQKDWTQLPMNERPISITNLRHQLLSVATVSNYLHCEIAIDYIIVELSLEELGIINATRR